MEQLLKSRKFSEINLSDPFFNTLKEDYREFEDWFHRKAENKAIIYEDTSGIIGFLYPKLEKEPLTEMAPPLPEKPRMKVGTFKIEAHGTKLGERFMKKIFDLAIHWKVEEIYVTIFPKHEGLVNLFKRFGFVKVAEKTTPNGTEDVYLRPLRNPSDQTLHHYPFFSTANNQKYLLAIYPEFHSRLFPDSLLNNESYEIVKDVSHTNSTHKVYVCYMQEAEALKPGDLLMIYRTKDKEDTGSAWYRAVATSICIVEEVRTRESFRSIDEYIDYCEKHSVFNREELIHWWNDKKRMRLFVIRMSYNAAFSRRIIRKNLVEQAGLSSEAHWNILELTNDQFEKILEMGGIRDLNL